MKGSLVCAIAIAVVAPWTNTIVATTALKPYDHVADMTQYHSSKLLTTFDHLPETVHWELETSSKHHEKDDEKSDKEEEEEELDDVIKEVEKEKEKVEKEVKKEVEKEKKEIEKEVKKEAKEEKHHALRGHHHHDDHASEPWDSYPFHPTHFVYKLQEDTESFIADLLDWIHDLVGDVNSSKLNVITQFTVTTTGPRYHPCGDLVAHKTFPVLERFLNDPAHAKLTPHRADKILWAPSRHCLRHHHSIEVDGGAHIEFEISCGEQVLLNASVASGGMFGNDSGASGALISVDFLNGAIQAIGASGPLGSLIKYRAVPENSTDILKDWTHKVRECAEKKELLVRGVVGGGWRQKYAVWGETSDESIVGYAEAFELTYQSKKDVSPAQIEGPADKTEAPDAETPETDAPVDEIKAPVNETEAQTQVPAGDTKTPRTETEVPAPETNTSVAETEAPHEAPANETQAPAEETVAPPADTEAPVGDTDGPAVETQAPSDETVAPVAETEAPVGDTDGPATETQAPAEETAAPVAEPEAPVGNTEDPAAEPLAPVEETVAPIAEPEAPVEDTGDLVTETLAPVEETAAPVDEVEAPVADTETPAGAQVPAEETEAPAANTESQTETQAPAADPEIPTTETVSPIAETAAPVEETEAPADEAEEKDAPTAETASPITETEPAAETPAAEETQTPVSETEETQAPVEPPVVGTEAPLETQPPAAELGAPDDQNETPVNEVDEPADKTPAPTAATDEFTTTSISQNDVSPTAQEGHDSAPESLYSEEPFHYDENVPEPHVPTDLASAKLKELSGATTAAYVHSGMQCRTKTSTSSACFMNTALAKVGHGTFAHMNLAMSNKQIGQDLSSPPSISLPLFGMVVIICVGAFATFRTTNRRHGYQPIRSVV